MGTPNKLSFEEAEHIRALFALTKISKTQLAKDYKVGLSSIRQIIRYEVYIPEHMKGPKPPQMCRLGLHDLNAPRGRNTDGVCRQCVNDRARRQRREKPEKYGRASVKYNRAKRGMKGADLSATKSGPCEICGKHANPLHMDHCHKTGYVRGWVCNRCNMQLGVLEQTEWIALGNEYLKNHADRINSLLASTEAGENE